MKLWSLVLATSLLTISLSGCGGPSYGKPTEITGKVVEGTEPVADVQVTFHAMDTLPADLRTRMATTDGEGQFKMADVYPGKYKVIVQKLTPPPSDPGLAPAEMTDDPYAKFGHESPLEAEVGPDKPKEFSFDLAAS